MNFSKIFIIIAALACQQASGLGNIIFRNNSGVFIVLEEQTNADGPGIYSKKFPLGLASEAKEQFTNFIIPGSELGSAFRREIRGMHIKYAKSANALSTMSAYYPINLDKIKSEINKCSNGDLIIEIQQEPWFGNEASIKIYCREELEEESFKQVHLGDIDVGLKELGLERTANPYKILGINPDASKDEITKAWRALAFKWHPDKVPADKQRQATIVIRIINNARDKVVDALTDPAYKRTLLGE